MEQMPEKVQPMMDELFRFNLFVLVRQVFNLQQPLNPCFEIM